MNTITRQRRLDSYIRLAQEWKLSGMTQLEFALSKGMTVRAFEYRMSDTIHGAQSSAIIYSIVETAKANDLKPYEYMKYLLEELPKHMDDSCNNMEFIDNLLPWSDKLPTSCRKLQQH